MAKWRAIPQVFGRVHPRHMTPSVSTLAMGGVSAVWFALILAFNSSGDVLGDAIAALGFCVAFYYVLTGLACAVFYRRELFRSVKNFVFAGLLPVAGFAMLAAVFVKAFTYYGKAGSNYSKPILGIQTPIFIGVGSLVLGGVLMLVAWGRYPRFFRRWWFESAPPGLLEQPVHHAEAHLWGPSHEHEQPEQPAIP